MGNGCGLCLPGLEISRSLLLPPNTTDCDLDDCWLPNLVLMFTCKQFCEKGEGLETEVEAFLKIYVLHVLWQKIKEKELVSTSQLVSLISLEFIFIYYVTWTHG